MGKKIVTYPNLRAELARAGLSVKDLAEYMHMTHQCIYKKFNGEIVLNEKDMRTIQEFLKANGGGAFTLDYLFFNGE